MKSKAARSPAVSGPANGANGFDVYAAPGIVLDHLVAHDNAQLMGVDWTAGIKLVDDNAASQNMTVQYSQAYNMALGSQARVGPASGPTRWATVSKRSTI
jgi:hypothetical protein